MPIRLDLDTLRLGDHVAIQFMRTLRIPDDGSDYPLPPGLGTFPILRVADYADRVPASWRQRGGVFIPMYQREALWLSFTGPSWPPHALKVGIGKVNAVSGQRWTDHLEPREEDYLVVPDQPWLDGINAGAGFIRQFVAMPLGMGYTVEAQVTGAEEFGGIQLLAVAPKPGRFPHRPPWPENLDGAVCCTSMAPDSMEMGLGAGGRMRQAIYPDPHGYDTWDDDRSARVFVHLVNSMTYREITGNEPPATPVTARSYTDAGLPWFDLYDEARSSVSRSDVLDGVKSIKEIDRDKGFTPQQDDNPIQVSSGQVMVLGDKTDVVDGTW